MADAEDGRDEHTALLDQVTAGIGVNVDALVETQRLLMADGVTGVQASADICAMCTSWSHVEVRAALAVAVMRLEQLTRTATDG